VSYSSLHRLETRTYRVVILLEGASAARRRRDTESHLTAEMTRLRRSPHRREEIDSIIGARTARGRLRGALDTSAAAVSTSGHGTLRSLVRVCSR